MTSLGKGAEMDAPLFRPGVSAELDRLVAAQARWTRTIHQWQQYLNRLVVGSMTGGLVVDTDYVKIHETDKSGIAFHLTKKRASVLKTVLADLLRRGEKDLRISTDTDTDTDTDTSTSTSTVPIKDIRIVTATSSNDEIDFPALTAAAKALLRGKEEMQTLQADVFQEVLGQLVDQMCNRKTASEEAASIGDVAAYVARLDVLLCKAHVAQTYRYCRPTLVTVTVTATATTVKEGSDINAPPGGGSVRAEGLRHPLIEHLQTQELYVTNDLDLESRRGMLLYGTNAVGKTSLIRALGIAVVLAQAGWYVPCRRFVLRPYRAIFSRILGNDNLFKGLSTFAVEMSELRLILNAADADSLILGDELCSGTETESALAIFTAGLAWMHQSGASFLFATHFHELIHYDEMQAILEKSSPSPTTSSPLPSKEGIRLKHLSVAYDRATDSLIYDRRLQDGPGNRMYGLEVCKSLHLPSEFLENAYAIRNKYHPGTGSCDGSVSVLAHPVSHFNAKKVRGMCERCHGKVGEEVHHLQPQEDADADGFIGHFHKNHVANLMNVCAACHDAMHIEMEDTSPPRSQSEKSAAGSEGEAETGSVSTLTAAAAPTKKRRVVVVRKKTTNGSVVLVNA